MNVRGKHFISIIIFLLLLLSYCSVSRKRTEGLFDDASISDASSTSFAFSVGGTLSGLDSGAVIVLQNNEGDDLTLDSNGSFVFETHLSDESSYEVTVRVQPEGQRCAVINRSGTIDGEDVTDVVVDCTSGSYTVGGVVSGLKGSGLVLRNNGSDDLAIKKSGDFAFATSLTQGSRYDVTVAVQPTEPDQLCEIARGSGLIGNADVADIEISCADRFTIAWFSASEEVVSSGDSVMLNWVTRGASSCEINPGAIQIEKTSSDFTSVIVDATTRFVLSCQGQGRSADSDPVTVYVTDYDWVDISVGNHTCAIKKDGRLFCWGNGQQGQLGTGERWNSDRPVQEGTKASDWDQVSAGYSHTCAIKTDGRLFCWGWGDGEHGGFLAKDTYYALVPEQESTAANDWLQVSAGERHTCAIKTDGRLFCWGEGRDGKLGTDSRVDYWSATQEGTAASDWAQVAAGRYHTCAIKTDGRLYCWGKGSSGQLGNSSLEGAIAPVQESTGATDWTQVSAGAGHTCAVKNNGRVFCWGAGGRGQLGNMTDLLNAELNAEPGSFGYSPVPVQESTAADDWVKVSAGYTHTCAVKRDGRLFCWGGNLNGELGNNTVADSPVPVQEHTGLSDWSRVSAGSSHTCGLKDDGRLFCWSAGLPSAYPVQEGSYAADWAHVSASRALKQDGRLYSWGFGPFGQANTDRRQSALVPVQEKTGAKDWAQVSGNCALKTDGRILCSDTETGDLISIEDSSSTAVWAQLSSHCAVTIDGRLFCWGYNAFGQLGNNSILDSSTPIQERTAATDWAEVSASGLHTCAVKVDGRLFCWGLNQFGALGNNSISNSLIPVQEHTAATDWAHVAVGSYSTCAFKRDQRLFCWGGIKFGATELGSQSESLVPIEETEIAVDWVQISTGDRYGCGVTVDGRLFCWGAIKSSVPELGTVNYTYYGVPEQEMTTASDWAEVAAGYDATCAIKTDGRLFCWGDNRYGQLAKSDFGSLWPVE